MENGEPKHLTIDELARMIANGFADMHEQFATLESHVGDLGVQIGQLDQKLDQHRQETKDGFAGLNRIIGGISATLADHEERIRALEGE